MKRPAPHPDLEPYLTSAGYSATELIHSYALGTDQGDLIVPLVAFAHEPLDAGSACIAVIAPEEDPELAVSRHQSLGAPVVFAHHDGHIQWWKQGGTPRLCEKVAYQELPRFFEVHLGQLGPAMVYRAKTRGVFERVHQLDFVDVGLMPLVESQVGDKLSTLVERATEEALHVLDSTKDHAGDRWLITKVFWLLAAKVLKDKSVPGFEKLSLHSVESVLEQVSLHYGASELHFALKEKRRREALKAAARIFDSFSSLAHVTPEGLASVYENTLVSKELRKTLGIHSTPAFLTRYVVWRLAPFIEEIPVERRQVLEPTCGQGSFLVAAMRLLRDLLPTSTSSDERKVYLRGSLHGLDLDPVAIELARLSLTLADIPNPDGWDLWHGDALIDKKLDDITETTTILLSNPPFENLTAAQVADLEGARAGSKASAILRRILPRLQPGGVFGVVLPQRLLKNKDASDLRKTITGNFEISEILLLSDKIFNYSGAEPAILIGRNIPQKARKPARYLRVREADNLRFQTTYQYSSKRHIRQEHLGTAPSYNLRVPDFDELWNYLRHANSFESIAKVGKGLEYKSKLPAGTITTSPAPFQNSKPGFTSALKSPPIHGLPQLTHLNLSTNIVRRSGLGMSVGIPQILIPYAPASRGPWRLKAFLDSKGHPITSRFLAIRPYSSDTSLQFLWALLNSPLANAFMFAHSSKRENLKETLERLPVPSYKPTEQQQITDLAKEYIAAASSIDRGPLFEGHGSSAKSILLAIDAKILQLYQLPPKLEKELLDYFAGWPRPGVPFEFDRYYSPGFESYVPLHVYLSSEFQSATVGRLLSLQSSTPEVLVNALAHAREAFNDHED